MEPEKNKQSLLNRIGTFLRGELLIGEFIIKQSKLFFLIFCLVLIFISNRYYCSKKITEMDNLRKELIELKYEQVILITKLTTVSRLTKIEESLQEKGIDLSNKNATIYYIK